MMLSFRTTQGLAKKWTIEPKERERERELSEASQQTSESSLEPLGSKQGESLWCVCMCSRWKWANCFTDTSAPCRTCLTGNLLSCCMCTKKARVAPYALAMMMMAKEGGIDDCYWTNVAGTFCFKCHRQHTKHTCVSAYVDKTSRHFATRVHISARAHIHTLS